MHKTKTQKKDIENLTKLNRWLVSSSVVFVFAYVVMLGVTATNVVTFRAVSKQVDEKKTELSQVELGYMNASNAIALEQMPETGFAPATGIAYVSTGSTASSTLVANNTMNAQ